MIGTPPPSPASPRIVVADDHALVRSGIIALLEAADLDVVGEAGTGQEAVALARLAQGVVAVESDPAMAREAEQALSAAGVDNAAVVEGPLAAGDPRHGPYDVILIEGGVEQVPDALAAQLREIGADVTRHDTNMLFVRVGAEHAAALGAFMQARGVLTNASAIVRLVTHLDVSRQQLAEVVNHWRAFLQR